MELKRDREDVMPLTVPHSKERVELLLVFGDYSKLEKLPLLLTFLVVLSFSVDAPFFLFLVGVVVFPSC